MYTHYNPDVVGQPFSAYSHGVAVAGASRWLYVSGQVGADVDGTTAGDSEVQMERCWTRILAILEDAGMNRLNIVKVNAFLTDNADIGLYREVRDRRLEGHKSASTLLIVAGLADPTWTVEIEVVAAA